MKTVIRWKSVKKILVSCGVFLCLNLLHGDVFLKNGRLAENVSAVVYGTYDVDAQKERLVVLRSNVGGDLRRLKEMASSKDYIERRRHPEIYSEYLCLFETGPEGSSFIKTIVWIRDGKLKVEGVEVALRDFLKNSGLLEAFELQVK